MVWRAASKSGRVVPALSASATFQQPWLTYQPVTTINVISARADRRQRPLLHLRKLSVLDFALHSCHARKSDPPLALKVYEHA
jgi:hypothetical protein